MMKIGFFERIAKWRSRQNDIGTLVFKDIMSIYWPKYMLIGLLSAIAFVFQIGGISIIISSFRSEFSLPLDAHTYLLKFFNDHAMIILSFLILSLSAVLMFIGRILTVNMMVDYESRTANSVFLRLSKKKKLKYDNSEIIRLLSKDCRFGGRIVQEISNLVMPVCVAFVAFPFLFYINVQATLVVLLVILLTLIPYIYIASRASTVSYSFEQSAGKDSQYKKDAINRIKKQTARVKNVSFPHEDFQKYYKKRLIMPHYGILIGGIQIAFCLVVLGWWAVSLERSSPHLGNIVLYGFVAVFMLNQLKSIAKVYANYHVFLAYFQRAFMVIKGISHESMQDKANAEDSVVEISEIDF